MQPDYRLPPDWSLTPVSTPLAEVLDPFQDFLGVAELQKKTAGKANGHPLTYAVLDTGIDADHRDLAGQIIDQADFTGSLFGSDDRHGHGTWCCGAIVAAANDYGVRGIAYEARLLSAKVLGDNGSGSDQMIARGLSWAYKKGADVFSLSLGGGRMSESLHGLFREISQQKGKFIFCAAGNDGGPVNYPAAWPEVAGVGAVDANGKLTKFTSRGPELDILAPGVAIVSTVPGNRHGTMTGTSMACPIAAAIGGLIYADAVNNGRADQLDSIDEMIALLRRTGRCEEGDECRFPLIDPRRLAKEFITQPPPVGGNRPPEQIVAYCGGQAFKFELVD
jgi:subtilisin family serine protease